MGLIGVQTSTARRPHRIVLQNPLGGPTSDGDGGYTQAWVDLNPRAVFAGFKAASANDLERLAAGTVIATRASVVELPYHPQVTTATRLIFAGQVYSVTGLNNREMRNVDLELLVVEVAA